ncbi:hypothetical protein XELAEV_18025915mg [Xenopus laevis]|uniref:Uncharacterized protein n=1 Tax=Xenopus laevis TaxID=8355 RepID=A0A974HMC8_XENLA|nr:hypothetical protein XELAEV_18025915mg [Xenopus laevis]
MENFSGRVFYNSNLRKNPECETEISENETQGQQSPTTYRPAYERPQRRYAYRAFQSNHSRWRRRRNRRNTAYNMYRNRWSRYQRPLITIRLDLQGGRRFRW